ncbi:hypothetical protein AK88_02223 [Plasmodium fragile]|uniref:Uncharacterized protein n=1 Tax=Plasmodium fragile TaxID=5857 RepID=A0A0D9QM64_PLAFR|nr:uncharacterized protein AK88_02223 [Plasmodium fragile]KJP88109.1 hypothetical protein AK88_02223 [Plasmodium fragile]
MAKTCYFPFVFLTYFFLSSALLARSDDGYVYSESASKYVRPNSNYEQHQEQQNVQPAKAQDGVAPSMVNNGPLSRPQSSLSVQDAEKREGQEGGSQSRLKSATSQTEEAAPKIYKTGDNTAVVAHKGSMVQKSKSSERLNDKIATMTTIFAVHPSKYIGSVKELFHLYNNNIDITKNGFTNGSISLHIEFNKHTSSEDVAKLNTVFYARAVNEDDMNVEIADGANLIDLKVDELLRENASANGLHIVSSGGSGGNVTSDPSANVYQAIKDSQLDATKLFITLNKEGEDKLSVSKLDDFLGECLKGAQDALTQANAADKKKKKKAGNLQNADEVSGSQATRSQTSSGETSSNPPSSKQEKAKKHKKTRKALMNEFKQSVISKDMERCKESAKLLMASSTISTLMYLFVLIALSVYLL